MSKPVRTRAAAKLNLALAVTGRRADGYHDLRSVFARVDLADDVRVARHTRLEVRDTVDVGPGEDLATRAVRALARAVGREPHAFVRIRKRIPLAAGLGGGSSDAAAVLRALAVIWKTGVDLAAVGAEIGSDVPFFARDVALALVSGRGESVAPLPAPQDPLHVVIVRPTLRLSTAEVFAELRDDDRHALAHVDALASAFARGPVTPELVRVHAENDLLAPAQRRCPAIASWRAAAAARGVALALTGSGPALFAVADDRADALRMARILARAGLRARPHLAAI
ncbi:MAG TPA: 4-(cytidine 5'-diphospho)-2-C-methyl-D-erythritol kinase [Candidatus Limnocylindria bacterium]|nr:4-(cytidine 5'-diphospho)-2-C-methyl-D-erythritol kinase [Candidatus Limnocylindria bacterium]